MFDIHNALKTAHALALAALLLAGTAAQAAGDRAASPSALHGLTPGLNLGCVPDVHALPGAGCKPDKDRAKPDFAFTPGALCTPRQPGFQEYRYAEHIAICKPNVTADMKREIALHYGVPEKDWGKYEFAFLIPPSLGGASTIDNVWLRPKGAGADGFEKTLADLMRAGKITQAEAVNRLRAHILGEDVIDGHYAGQFQGGGHGQILFTIKDAAVTGTISGTCTQSPCGNDPMHGEFSGTVTKDGKITTALHGTLTDSNDVLGSFRFSGAVLGTVTGSKAQGEWNGKNAFGAPSGSWSASR